MGYTYSHREFHTHLYPWPRTHFVKLFTMGPEYSAKVQSNYE